MEGIVLKKFMLKKAQIALKNLGTTNRARWVLFSPFDELTPLQFSKQLTNWDVSLNPAECFALWKMCGIKTKIMKYEDFVKFLYYEMPQSIYDSDSFLQFYELLRSRKHLLMPLFLGCDTESTGFIKISEFYDLIRSIMPQATDFEISQLCQNYDSQNNGTLNYYLVMSDLNASSLTDKAKPNTESFSQKSQEAQGNMLLFSEDLIQPPFTRGPGFGGRGELDPEVFPDARKKLRRNSFSDMDDFISEHPYPQKESPRISQTPQKINFHLSEKIEDHTSKTEPPTESHKVTFELSETINPPKPEINTNIQQFTLSSETVVNAKQMLAAAIIKIGSAHEFFTKHQNGTTLTAEEIHDGIYNDSNYDFPIDTLHLLIQCNGGPFSLSEFVSLISDAEQYKTKKVDFSKLRLDTEEDVVLTRIAQRTAGKVWETHVSSAATPKQFVNGLAQSNIYISENSITTLFDRLGTDGLISAIKEKALLIKSSKKA